MELLTTAVLILIVVVLLYIHFSRNDRHSRIPGPRSSRIPGPRSYPVVGAALQLKTGRYNEQFYEFACRYGKMFEIKIFGTTAIFLNRADIIRKAFCEDGYKLIFNDRPDYFFDRYVYLGKSLTFRNRDKIQGDLRKALAKGMHFFGDRIAVYDNIIKKQIYHTMKRIEDRKGGEFEVCELSKKSVGSIISIVLTGDVATDADIHNFFSVEDGHDDFASPIPNALLLNLPFLLHLPFYKTKFDKLMKARQKIIEKYFYKVKESRTPGQIRGVVDWYLNEQLMETEEDREPLITDDGIKATLIEFITAGVITASALPGVILCLAKNPGYQIKLQEELDKTISVDREPSVTDKHNCPFLDAVIIESLRLLAPGPFALVHRCSSDTVLEGYKIKADAQVIMNIWFVHHDEEVWGDPWTFRPERFLDEDGKLLPYTHPLMKSWMPFGMGRRKCPGINLATAMIFMHLSFLFRKWTFLPSPGKCGSCDPRTGKFHGDLVFKPDPFYCIAKQRE